MQGRQKATVFYPLLLSPRSQQLKYLVMYVAYITHCVPRSEQLKYLIMSHVYVTAYRVATLFHEGCRCGSRILQLLSLRFQTTRVSWLFTKTKTSKTVAMTRLFIFFENHFSGLVFVFAISFPLYEN